MNTFNKMIVAAAFLGLVAMPLSAMAADTTTGTATNTATYQTGLVYQNSSVDDYTETTNLNVQANDFTASLLGFKGDVGGFYFNESLNGGSGYHWYQTPGWWEYAEGGAGGGFNFENEMKGAYFNGDAVLGNLNIDGSLNATFTQDWNHTYVATSIAADMGSVDMTSTTSAYPGSACVGCASTGSLSGSASLAGQLLTQHSGGDFYASGNGGYASGGGGSNYTGVTGTLSAAGGLNLNGQNIDLK